MLTLIALVVAVLFLPSPWNVVVVVAAAIVDAVEAGALVWWSRRRRRISAASVGMEALVGRSGIALGRLDPDSPAPVAQVRVEGEIWNARASEPIDPGAAVTRQRRRRAHSSRSSLRGTNESVVQRPAVRTLKLTIEYDGGGFHGWARQPGQRTVEGALRDALDVIYPRAWDGLAVAGRTDTGVHATGQVASVTVRGGAPPARAAEALNTALPGDVSVLAAEDGAGGLPCPLLRLCPLVSLPRPEPRGAVGARSEALALVASSGRSDDAAGVCCPPARRARLQGLHPGREPTRGVPAHHS